MNIKKKILLVDDEPIISLSEKMTLEQYGYAVITASSGERAVELVGLSSDIDLVLMDIDLGKGIDGTETASRILSGRDIPVIFLSSHTEPEIVEKTEKITSYGYVVKNSSITVLDASIKMAFKLFDAKKKTEKSENRFAFLANNIPDIRYSLDREGNIESINYRSLEDLGFEEVDVAGKSFAEFVHPDDRAVLVNSFLSALREKREKTTGLQFRLLTANGREIRVEMNAYAQFGENGEYLGEQGVLRDITERTRIENRIKESESRYRLISENISDGLVHFSAGYEIDYVSPSYVRLLGYSARELAERSGEDIFSLIHEEDRPRIAALAREAVATGRKDLLYTCRVKTASGPYIWREDHAHFVYTGSGTFDGAYVICRDITARKKAEKELVESEEKFRQIAENMEEVFWLRTAEDSGLLYISPSYERVWGRSCESLYANRHSFMDSVHEEDRQRVSDRYEEYWKGARFDLEYRIVRPDNEIRWIRSQAFPVRNAEGEVVRHTGIATDITERKQAEEELKNANTALLAARESADATDANDTTIMEGTRDSIWAFNLNYEIIFINHVFRSEFQQAFGVRLEPGTSVLDSLPAALRPLWKSRYDRVFSNEQFMIEDAVDTNGGGLYIQVLLNPMLKNGRVIGGSCFGSNITERKKAEKEINKLLAEKELLLKEVHHRIKNNMATISGLLLLQADVSTDPASSDSLHEAGNRVKSMQILYDKLYRSPDFHQLGLAAYLDPLTDEILSNFPDSSRFRITKRFDDIALGVNILQPLGIIMNELLTNTMKYAFIGRSEGTISIEATVADNLVTLSIYDDGSGFPETVDFEHSAGFGLILVQGLTKQLDGRIRLERGKGTRIVLEFGV